MILDRALIIIVNIAIGISCLLLLLISAPWTVAPAAAAYYGAVAAFWLLLLLRLLLGQWQKTYALTYKSYIGPDNRVRKKLITPGGREIAKAAAGLLKPAYLLGLALLISLFWLNHLLLFAPQDLPGPLAGLWGAPAAGGLAPDNVLLAICLVSVLILAGTVLAQTYAIKQNNETYNIQNLIINGHSPAALGELQIRMDDGEQMFLASTKQEYVMQAKPIPALRQTQSQAVLQLSVFLQLSGDIPVTDFYIKRLSLFVADTVIECENDQTKFYPLFAVNNDFSLNFYIFFKETSARRLADKIFTAAGLRLYFCFILKNSVGVITELFGTALYEKDRFAEGSQYYALRETKGNQYFYV